MRSSSLCLSDGGDFSHESDITIRNSREVRDVSGLSNPPVSLPTAGFLIDAVSVNLTEYEFTGNGMNGRNGLNGDRIKAAPHQWWTRTTRGQYRDGTCVENSVTNCDDGAVHVTLRQDSSLSSHINGVCAVQWSMPRVRYGSNYYPIDQTGCRAAIHQVENVLRNEFGINTDLSNAVANRLELSSNHHFDFEYRIYQPFLEILYGKRMQDRRFGGTTFTWGNKQRQLIIYDKLRQMEAERQSIQSLPATIRGEYRLWNSRAIRKALSTDRLGDIIDRYHSLPTVLSGAMQEYLFFHDLSSGAKNSTTMARPRAAGQTRAGRGRAGLVQGMSFFKARFGRNWRAQYFQAVGRAALMDTYTLPDVRAAFSLLGDDDRRLWHQEKQKMQQARVEVLASRTAPRTNLPQAHLYQELKEKFLGENL